MDMLRSASQWLNGKRNEYLSVSVGYLHGSSSTTINATRGRSVFRADNGYGVVVLVHTEDFIISSATINFSPEKGDEIICEGRKYEVLAPNDEPVWRWCDSAHESIRIHTKDMGNA